VSPFTPRIRPVEASHVADLIRIGEETRLSAWSAQSYLDEIKNPDAIVLRLVSEENETIGFVVGRLVPGGEIETRIDAEIYNIAIVATHQGQGNGLTLLRSFIRRSSEAGARYVWLEVRESNEKAINFYKANRFEQVQTRPNFYSEPRENAILMRLELNDQKG
jgi:[ribosomal protein S18]-alanine N-acetyltransferase